jgi:streptomycin 6-kinase
LKLSPDGETRPAEIDALRLFDGRGACRVLGVDEAQGSLLLERLLPGTGLHRLTDDETATRIAAAAVMRRLWRPLPATHRLETLEERGRGFERLRAAFGGGTGPYPRRLVEQAEHVFREYPKGVTPQVLHGDCHHFNILLTRDRHQDAGEHGNEEWLAIDPHGVAGDPGYEVGAFIYNPGWPLDPLEQPDPGRAIARRVDVLAECLSWHRSRVRGWCLAQCVLSSWWTYEDHARFEPATLIVAQHLERLDP